VFDTKTDGGFIINDIQIHLCRELRFLSRKIKQQWFTSVDKTIGVGEEMSFSLKTIDGGLHPLVIFVNRTDYSDFYIVKLDSGYSIQ
jgi:hypothetical protein